LTKNPLSLRMVKVHRNILTIFIMNKGEDNSTDLREQKRQHLISTGSSAREMTKMQIKKIRLFDKYPNNTASMMIINDLKAGARRLGYNCYISKVNRTRIDLQDIRLSQSYIDKFGHNINNDGRRGRYLSWTNWTLLIDMINDVLDKLGISANVSSQHNLMKIRNGNEKRSAYEIECDLWDYAHKNDDRFMSKSRWVDHMISGWRSEHGHDTDVLRSGI